MRILVFGLTLLAVVLFIAQFFGQKGTRNHILRGILVGILSLTVVVINTVEISLKRGLIWDDAFIIHTLLGSLFFLGLVATSVAGYLVKNKRMNSLIHKRISLLTGFFLFLTLSAAVLLRFAR